MAMRSAMHRAGAAALSRLLSMDGGHPAQLDCACGQTARYHDTRPKQLLTVLGPLELRRAYYHCAHCQKGQAPRDRELDVVGTQCSPGMRRMLAVVGSESSFEQGRAQLELLAGLDVTTKAVELVDLFGRLAKRGRAGERLADAFAFNLTEQTKLRMPGTVGLGAVTAGFSATAGHGGDGAGAEVAERQKLLQQAGSLGFQIGQSLGHGPPPILSIYIYSE